MGGWGEYADEARRLWGAMHGAASASSSIRPGELLVP